MRNPNGYGTVYKMKGNRRRPYVAKVPIGVDPKTKRMKYKVLGYFKESPDALLALARYHQDPDEIAQEMHLEQLYTEWSKSKYKKISIKTQNSYEVAWKHLEPIKNMKVANLRKSDIQKIIDNMSLNGMGYSSVHKVKVLAKMLLDDAMANDIVSKNYAALTELPKQEKKEKEAFSDEEIDKITKAADEDEWISTIMIFIYTGLRISELLQLKKSDVDLGAGFITGGVKTDAGKNRIVPIHPKIRKHMEYWMEKDEKTDYLISRNSTRVLPNYYRKYLYHPAIERLAVSKLTPHAARHTCATLMSRAGADTIAIQKIMGHADYATTANIYTHKNLEELKNAIEKI